MTDLERFLETHEDATDLSLINKLILWCDWRWEQEVSTRPDVNIFKHTLDQTWCQVRRMLQDCKDESTDL